MAASRSSAPCANGRTDSDESGFDAQGPRPGGLVGHRPGTAGRLRQHPAASTTACGTGDRRGRSTAGGGSSPCGSTPRSRDPRGAEAASAAQSCAAGSAGRQPARRSVGPRARRDADARPEQRAGPQVGAVLRRQARLRTTHVGARCPLSINASLRSTWVARSNFSLAPNTRSTPGIAAISSGFNCA